MRWRRAVLAWLLIAAAESVHGTLRRLFLEPMMGDLPARQLSVATGSLIILLIACLCIRWIGARTLPLQIGTGLLWAGLMLAFEFGLGLALGYDRARILSDYDPARGGFLAVGIAFMVMSPVLAARLRHFG
ncbi:hypothetical protein SAMN06265795_11667 [Noviherbaspirillum humi]|uniref:Uncharacterized protein n=1 Tax=Noviherbaspirillum humi TaxID=1688639 RepID=A0A239KMC6_9BURK|nr:hypothetical protein [Noviherbaspirillum humi]SNT18848.1 hypothetical protein SAMN06265795_11667 [Noviherbaspirillum humi]